MVSKVVDAVNYMSTLIYMNIKGHSDSIFSNFFLLGAPVAEWLRPLIFSALNHLSSQRYGFEPNSGSLVRQAKFCLHVVRCFFSVISQITKTSFPEKALG